MAKLEPVEREAFVLKCFLSLLILACALTPTWAYLLARFVLEPEGFWQNLILLGIGVWLLGSAQVLFFVGAVAAVVFLWLLPVIKGQGL